MSLHTLQLDHKALDVALSGSGTRLAVLSDIGLAVYALDMNKRPIPKPSLLWRSDTIKSHCPRHVAFVGDDHVHVLTDDWDDDESCLWRSKGEDLVLQGPLLEAGSASSLIPSVDSSTLYIQSSNGALHQVHFTEDSSDLPPQMSLAHKFPSIAPEVRLVSSEDQVCLGSVSLVNRLIPLEIGIWPDEERSTVREREIAGPQLHFICSYPFSSRLHNKSAPP
jgi:elongator complex protein 1